MIFIVDAEIIASDILYLSSAILMIWRLVWGFIQAKLDLRGNIKVLLSNLFFIIQMIMRLAWLYICYPTLENTVIINYLEIASDSCQYAALSLYIHQWFTFVIFKDIPMKRPSKIIPVMLYCFDGIACAGLLFLLILASFESYVVEIMIDVGYSFLLLVTELFFLAGGITRIRFFKTNEVNISILKHKQIPLFVASCTGIILSAVRVISSFASLNSDQSKFTVTPLLVATIPDCCLAMTLVFSYGH